MLSNDKKNWALKRLTIISNFKACLRILCWWKFHFRQIFFFSRLSTKTFHNVKNPSDLRFACSSYFFNKHTKEKSQEFPRGHGEGKKEQFKDWNDCDVVLKFSKNLLWARHFWWSVSQCFVHSSLKTQNIHNERRWGTTWMSGKNRES